jgi:DNA-binding protein HU-beta
MENPMKNGSRGDLIDDLVHTTDLTKDQAFKAVDGLFDAILHRAANGQKIIIRGFGTFEMKTRPARLGRNPRTGEAVEIPARSTLTFRAAKTSKA